MNANPEIEIFGQRVVRFDHCQVGHISREGTVRRFWFWPEYDMRAARPVTGDLSPWLNDAVRLRKAIRAALTRIMAKPSQDRRTARSASGLPRWPFQAYVEKLARKRNQRLFAKSRHTANRR